PSPKRSREVLDQLAEVNALLRQVVEDNALPSKNDLGVHEVHLQSALGHQFTASGEVGLLLVSEPRVLDFVLGRGQTNDFTVHGVGQEARGGLGGAAENVPQLEAAIAADHHSLAAGMILSRQTGEFPKESHSAIANDVSLDHPATSAG